MGFLKAEVRTR